MPDATEATPLVGVTPGSAPYAFFGALAALLLGAWVSVHAAVAVHLNHYSNNALHAVYITTIASFIGFMTIIIFTALRERAANCVPPRRWWTGAPRAAR